MTKPTPVVHPNFATDRPAKELYDSEHGWPTTGDALWLNQAEAVCDEYRRRVGAPTAEAYRAYRLDRVASAIAMVSGGEPADFMAQARAAADAYERA